MSWEKYQDLVIKEAQKVILPNYDPSSKELQEVWVNHIAGASGPTSIQRNLSRDEIFFNRVFNGYIEIFDSFYSLQDIEIFISSFPYRNKRIQKSSFLSYHITNYFNEVYIFKERLLAYLTILGRCFRGDVRHPSILKTTRPMFGMVRKFFLKITNIRGEHVHQIRFSDRDIARIKSMEILIASNDERLLKVFVPYLKQTFIETRKKWKQNLKNNNKYIMEFLNIYSDLLIPLLFNDDEELIYPILNVAHQPSSSK